MAFNGEIGLSAEGIETATNIPTNATLYNNVKNTFQKFFNSDFHVTLNSIFLGPPDSVTGWYSVSYASSWVEMLVFPKGNTNIKLLVGWQPFMSAVGLTTSTVTIGSYVTDGSGKTYRIETITPYLYRRNTSL